MKKIVLFVCLVLTVSARAQVKDLQQLVGYNSMSAGSLRTALTPGYWKLESEGKPDSMFYIRWIPTALTEKNMGEMIMCFYKKKGGGIDYLVFQTLDKSFFNKLKASIVKSKYKLGGADTKTGNKIEYYSNGVHEITLTEDHKIDASHVTYLLGIRKAVTTAAGAKKTGIAPMRKK